jgi:hypothetical protein
MECLNSAQKHSNQPKIAALAAIGYPPSGKSLISTKIVRCTTLEACFCCQIPRCCAYLQSRQLVRTPECITLLPEQTRHMHAHRFAHAHKDQRHLLKPFLFNRLQPPHHTVSVHHLQASTFTSLAHCVFLVLARDSTRCARNNRSSHALNQQPCYNTSRQLPSAVNPTM